MINKTKNKPTDCRRMIILLGVMVLLGVILAGSVSAWNWDNVKSYDKNTATARITNALGMGEKIADIRLITPHINYVPSGDDVLVAKMEFVNYKDYKDLFNDLKFYDLKKNNKEQKNTYTYKIWDNNIKNWTEFDSTKGLKSGNFVVGIFTSVKYGDKVEWIPTLFGITINEWAIYENSIGSGTFLWSIGDLGTAYNTGQTFTVGLTGANVSFNISQVELRLGVVGNPTSLNVSIKNTTNGVPNTITLVSANVLKTSFSSTTSLINISFPNPDTPLHPGKTYIIELSCRGACDESNYFIVNRTANLYAAGNYLLGCPWRGDPISGNNYQDYDIEFRTYGELPPLYNIVIELLSPANNSISSSSSITLQSNITPSNLDLTNATFYLWNSTNNLINQTTNIVTGDSINSTSVSISGLSLNNYYWNVLGCGINDTSDTFCYYSDYNSTFLIGATSNVTSYNLHTYETASETFTASYNLLSSAEVSLVQLVYNNINYTISDISQSSNSLNLSKTIDIPVNNQPQQNQTNTFTFRFTYGGTLVQESETYYQNTSFINLQICNTTFSQTSLNFTMYDEKTGSPINYSLGYSPTTFQTSWNYWVGSGSIYKNYSNSTINITSNNYRFCIYPYLPSNFTFKSNLDSSFIADGYSSNNYYLRNATMTNYTSSSNIPLYLLDSDISTKFYVNIKYGTDFLKDGVVQISKYFIGEGAYKTIGIKYTDNAGQFPLYSEIDAKLRFTITKDGVLLGVIEKTASCATAPCSIDINIQGTVGDIFTGYYDYFSTGVLSNLSFDLGTKMVSYNFVDITGLANYFRLEVQKVSFNETVGDTVCNTYSYTSSGSLSCNLTGKTGDYYAKTFISRGPERADKSIAIAIITAITDLGILGLLLNVAILLTVTISAAVVSRGNPSAVVFIFGVGIILLKIVNIFPFNWVVVISLEALLLYLLIKLKT